AMPRRAWASGPRCVTSVPENSMRPELGARSPATQLKNVDLPAPFGPISPTISPAATSSVAPESAMKLPKLRVTSRALSSMALCRRFLPAARRAMRQPPPQVDEPARLEPGQHHDDAAVQDIGEAGPAAAEQRIRHGLQRDQDDGAEQRAEQGPGAAERRDDDHLDRAQNAEAAFRIDEADHQRIKRTGDRGEGRADEECVELIAAHRHAEAARRALAGPDGAPVIAHAAAL